MFDCGCASVTSLGYFLFLIIFHFSILSAELPSMYFTKSPKPIAAPLNDDVIFTCSLNIQPEEYQWKFGSKLLPHNKSQNSLTVQVTGEDQVGDYQCIGRYNSKTALASKTARLSLVDLQPFPPQKEEFYQVSPGNTFTILCPPPSSNPVALIHYIKDDDELPATTPILSTTGSLLLTNVTVKDAGVYSCSASNYITNKSVRSEMKIHVNITENGQLSPPRFLHEPQSTYTVQTGSNITLECTAVGHPVPKITWQKAGSELPHDRTEVVPGGLNLWKVLVEDAGEYICDISNGVGPTLSRNITVQVQEPPRVVKGPTQDIAQPEEGGELNLTCDVKGTPEPTVKWLLNSEPLDSDKSVIISGNTLKIRNIEKHHVGVYQCFATNPVGSVFGATLVNISPKEVKASKSGFDRDESSTRPPSNSGNHGKRIGGRKEHHGKNDKNRPKDKQRKEGPMGENKPNVTRLTDHSLMVRWSVPSNPGLNIAYFKVQHISCNTTGGSGQSKRLWLTNDFEIQSHIRAFEFENLEAEQSYKFRIAAVFPNFDNTVGSPSKCFKLNKNDAASKPPPTPKLLSAEPVSQSAIRIHWQCNSSSENPVDGFYVYYRMATRADSYAVVAVEGENTQTFVISELVANTRYEIKVRSFTLTAASESSSVLCQNTKMDKTLIPSPKDSRKEEKKPEPPHELPPNHSQLYLIIGVAVGGFGLLILAVFLCCCFRRQSNSSSDEDGTESCSKIGDTALTIQQLEPVTMNGYANHNGKMLNGRTSQRNGFNCHAITITNNPLAESEQSKNVMELSYLSSQNNNCSAEGSSN